MIEDITFTGFKSTSGYLRNLRGRLLSSEKFSEDLPSEFLPLGLKPFPENVHKMIVVSLGVHLFAEIVSHIVCS